MAVALLWLIRLLLSNLLTQNKRPTDQIYRDMLQVVAETNRGLTEQINRDMLQVVADRRQQRQETD